MSSEDELVTIACAMYVIIAEEETFFLTDYGMHLQECLHIHTHLFSICPKYPLTFAHLLPTR